MPDIDGETIAAAAGGDTGALAAVLASAGPLAYGIAGPSLRWHPRVDEVVNRILARLVAALGDIQSPSAFSAWLSVVAVAELRVAGATGFARHAILGVGEEAERAQVVEAARWLDGADEELLVLWWLERAGALERADVAKAAGLSRGHVAVRVHRMRERLETATSIVRALTTQPRCPRLAWAARSWAGKPSPLWRKRLARHVRECDTCRRGRNPSAVNRDPVRRARENPTGDPGTALTVPA